MNRYEIMYIIAAALDSERKETIIDTVKGIIESGSGEVLKTNVMGLRKLAYPIQKKNEGYYVLVDFKASAELPKELDRRLKISDDIVRHLIIGKDDDTEIA